MAEDEKFGEKEKHQLWATVILVAVFFVSCAAVGVAVALR